MTTMTSLDDDDDDTSSSCSSVSSFSARDDNDSNAGSEDSGEDVLRRICEEQRAQEMEKHRAREAQVQELQELNRYFASQQQQRSSSSAAGDPHDNDNAAAVEYKQMVQKAKHLLMLETCNGLYDIAPLKKAADFMYENPIPLHLHRQQQQQQQQEEELGIDVKEYEAYDDAISFEKGSDEWCFVMLLHYKPCQEMDKHGVFSLVKPHQTPQDACIENGIVCAQCLKPGIAGFHSQTLLQCSRCKVIRYCSRACQSQHWDDHKLQCRKNRIKTPGSGDRGYNQGRANRIRFHEETKPILDFIRSHPYPSFDMTVQLLWRRDNDFQHLNYTLQMHERCKHLYSYIGKNTYTVHGKAFGEYVYALGGNPAMCSAVYIFSHVIKAFAPQAFVAPLSVAAAAAAMANSDNDNDDDRNIGPVLAELNARRLLSLSWTDIPEWQD